MKLDELQTRLTHLPGFSLQWGSNHSGIFTKVFIWYFTQIKPG